jgi:diguanylate cyclase (GGDEF)-like protein
VTLRARLAAAFFVVVLGPAILGGYLLLSLLTPAAHGAADRIEPNTVAVRALLVARCQQLSAKAQALAAAATGTGRPYAVTPAAAVGPWVTCGGPDLLLPPLVAPAPGTRYTGLAAQAGIRGTGIAVSGYAYAVQPFDGAFLADLSSAAGVPLVLVGVDDPGARADLPLPLAISPVRGTGNGGSGPGGPTVLVAVMATAVLISFGCGWWLAGVTTRPLDVLLRAVERVVAGDLTVRSNVAGRDATGRLGRGLDRLIAGMQQTQHLSVTDPLTGLGNVRQLGESLRLEVERASRFGRSLGILVLDLDHFKTVNDRHGHRAGDAVLVEFSRRVRAVVREVDQAFRQGGEEFVILLPETDVAGSLTAARRIGEAVRDVPFQVAAARAGDAPSVRIAVTVSIGVAVFPRHAQSGAEVLDAADAALYAAKHAGRDTFALAKPLPAAARLPPAEPLPTRIPGQSVGVTPVALLAEAGGASGGTTSPLIAPGG